MHTIMSYEVLRSCMEVYQEQLEELEIVVLESKVLGSVVVMGDFNALHSVCHCVNWQRKS